MNQPPLESFLARLYTDAKMRARFLADADTEARQAGLSPADRAAVLQIDPIQLRLAARSFAHKRHKRAGSRTRPKMLQRWLVQIRKWIHLHRLRRTSRNTQQLVAQDRS